MTSYTNQIKSISSNNQLMGPLKEDSSFRASNNNSMLTQNQGLIINMLN